MRRVVLATLIAWFSSAPARAEEVHDPGLGVRLRLPPGFEDFPAGRAVPNTVHSFARGVPGGLDFAAIGIEQLNGTIGRERLTESTLPREPGVHIELRTARWKEFEIDVLASRLSEHGIDLHVLVAQVPLLPKAIQLKVFGRDEAEVTRLLQALLADLDGRTNWLRTEERIWGGAKAAGGLAALVAVAAWAIWARRRRADRAARA